MIEATVIEIPDTRTEERGSQWKATAEFRGVAVEAISRSSPIYDLCRTLKAAGCEDARMLVRYENRPAFIITSIHRGAGLTARESATFPIREVPYQAWADR